MRKLLLLCLTFTCLHFISAAGPFIPVKERFSLRNDSIRLFDVSPVPNRARLHLINYTIAAVYPASMLWLYTQWYSGYPQSAFHFFNDNGEWQQMDKFAHMWDAYSVSKPIMKLFYWSGMSEKKSALYGTGIAYLFQTTVEVFDGFSSEWGFSPGDVIANTLGAGTILSQQLLWDEQRITLKYSFHQTKYAKYRPGVLGSNVLEGILKDYNGLTCWMSINPYSFMKKDSKFPKWLSLGLGYGAEGMTGGYSNPSSVDGQPIPAFERYRQYYFAIDFDLARIETRSKFLGGLFKLVNIIHLPAPAIEINEGRAAKFHALYF
ncbi:DUF2279 domain-containing protein [soil metagenome]